MLKRCSPRSSTSAVNANGSASTSAAPFLPVKNATSSCSVPRATVPSTSGRALEPLRKNTLSRSGIALGELCMSWRQPAARNSKPPKKTRVAPRTSRLQLRLNFADLRRIEPLQKVRRPLAIELRILGLDEQEKLVAAGALEGGDVERRVVRLRQPVQHDHADHRGERGEQDGQLEGDRNELRPAVERLAGDVHRIRQEAHPLLQPETGEQTGDAAGQDDERQSAI